MFNYFVASLQVNYRIHIHLNLTILVNDPTAEVPRQLKDTSWFCLRLQFFRMASEVLEYVVSLFAIHTYLVHQWKLNAVLSPDISLD